MQKVILFFLCFVLVISLNAQSKNNGLDTLKKGIRNIGNVFKKAGTVTFAINNIDNANNDLLLLKKNIQQTINVKKIEDNYEQTTATLKISYKGKATDLWNSLSANAKQAFTLNQMNDSFVSLNYRYAKTTAPTSVATKDQSTSNNKSTIKNSADSNNLRKASALFLRIQKQN